MASSSRDQKDGVLALYEKALKYLHGGKFDQASKTFQQVREKYPDEVEVLARVNCLDKVCMTRQEAPDLSKAEVEELYTSGLVEHNSGNYEEALDFFKRALERSKTDGDYIHFALAATEARLGNRQKALQHLEKSLEMNSDNKLLARRDADFESLASDETFRKLVGRDKRE